MYGEVIKTMIFNSVIHIIILPKSICDVCCRYTYSITDYGVGTLSTATQNKFSNISLFQMILHKNQPIYEYSKNILISNFRITYKK